MKKKNIFLLASLLAGSLLITSCTNVAMTSASAVYNRSSLQSSFSDHYTDMKVSQALYWGSKHFKDSNISINTFNGEVLLTGQIPSPELQQEATELASNAIGVTHVYNMTKVTNPISALTKTSDSWITAKIKSRLIANSEIDPSRIKVVTEDGTVYLMGLVLPEQAAIATDIARSTDGVDNVVTMFSYIKISKQL
ncbi:MAG: BON domain-containing protein [Gammaproteobacteria bacterium]|nr:BON domain-containing protein [Gammaproteobacteria bacterium]